MRDGHLLATRQHLAAHGHAVGIVPLTIETLHEAGETFDAITHVAAGCGPGSFTGIRVTLAAAKGFCMAHLACRRWRALPAMPTRMPTIMPQPLV